jgi:hypothetical protein
MWILLDSNELRTHLTVPELSALANIEVEDLTDQSTNPDAVEAILQAACHNVAETWRGRLRTVTAVDKRTDYVPTELLQYILIHVRYSAYTRLPNMETLLDKLRQREWERANQIFDNLGDFYIEPPEDPEEDPRAPKMSLRPGYSKMDTEPSFYAS